MHIPDGILAPSVLVTGAALTVAIMPVAVKKAQAQFDQASIPKMGVMAAFIFAAQMINFPIVGGASGHLIGAALAAILFGFWPATIIMTTIVSLQALLFGDGGITVLGVNIFNMAIVAPALASGVYYFCKKIRLPGAASIFSASFLSVVGLAVLVGFELGFSDVTSYQNALFLIVGWHLLIGVGEGLITMVILPFAFHSRFGKEAVSTQPEPKAKSRRIIWIWLGVALVIGGIVSLFASSNPDGFEKTAEQIGVLDQAKTIFNSPFPDYTFPGMSGTMSAILIGVIGVLITIGVFLLISKLVRKKP